MNTHPTLSQFTRTWMAKDEEIRAAYQQIAKLEADLTECRQYLEAHAVWPGPNSQPNRAMQLVTSIDETLNGPGGF